MGEIKTNFKTTVVITHYNDKCIFDTMDSLLKQTKKPTKVLVADGGSPLFFQEQIKRYIKPHKNFEFALLPGRCIDTRRQTIDRIIHKTDIIIFIDSDETAPENWLERLIKPILNGEADYTGGPFVSPEPKSKPERILNEISDEYNALTKKDISYLAMGNSAWHVNVFKTIGNFDSSSISGKTDEDSISGSYHVSDDFDINLRAKEAGLRGVFVDEAWVLHDQSRINTYWKLIKYFYGQFVRTVMAYSKHKSSLSKLTSATRQVKIVNKFQYVLFAIKPIAYIHGKILWSRI